MCAFAYILCCLWCHGLYILPSYLCSRFLFIPRYDLFRHLMAAQRVLDVRVMCFCALQKHLFVVMMEFLLKSHHNLEPKESHI